MLRYRLQPSLTRLGIQLYWDVQDHPALDRLPILPVPALRTSSAGKLVRVVDEARAPAAPTAGRDGGGDPGGKVRGREGGR